MGGNALGVNEPGCRRLEVKGHTWNFIIWGDLDICRPSQRGSELTRSGGGERERGRGKKGGKGEGRDKKGPGAMRGLTEASRTRAGRGGSGYQDNSNAQ
jgi:hypothetical protein